MPEPYAEQEVLGSVVRSPLDAKVWVAVLPDSDTYSGAMHASTSARRCKRYAESAMQRDLDLASDRLIWCRDDDDTWSLYERSDSPGATGG